MKKEFLSQKAKEYNKKSDTELIDLIATDQSLINQETAKAILDKRTKKVIQYLTEVIKGNSKITEKYNKRLIGLTWAIAILTFLMLIGLGIQFWITLR